MGAVSRWLKVLTWVAAIVVIVLIAGIATAYWTVRRSYPQTEGTIALSGLEAPVRVLRDDFGIPQVYATTSHDLFYAQGYVQAQDRFFEMDFRRHVTSGRLSEMVGRDALETDMFVRTLGWRRVAEAELPLLSTDTRQYLEAYSDGVNAYLDDRSGADLSLEYAVLDLNGLDYTPEEWTAADSLAWLKAMAWNLGTNIDDELERSLESVRLGDDEIAELFPDYPYDENDPIVKQGGVVDGVYEQDAKEGGTRLPERPGFFVQATAALQDAKTAAGSLRGLLSAGDGIGSNAWAVSGQHTASGAPMLANDPHLDASMPSPWYQMGLHCEELTSECPFDVAGFTFSGLPGVIIGHNNRIAWGFSNLYPDVQDLYLEQVTDNDQYLYNGRARTLSTREESFVVAGEDDPVTITVRESRHGPLISDVSDDYSTVGADAPVPEDAPEQSQGYAVALRWTALDPGKTADALFGINKARNWAEFRDAARTFVAPSQNLVYADVDGHIGYQAPGLIPIRRTGHGDWPVPGWDPAYEWADYIPFEALPNVLDPDDGYVVTANQAIVGKDYPYYIGDSYDYGYRSQRIRDLLRAKDALTPEDMADIQLDDYTELGRRLTPMLQSVELPSGYYTWGQRVLSRWDFRTDVDSQGAAYFNVVWRQLIELTFADQLPSEVTPDGGSRWWTVMLRLMVEPRNSFWDDIDTTEVRETRDDIIIQAEINARDELTRLLSRNPRDWRWGQLHQLTLTNETLGSDDSPAAFLFNRGGYELPGGPSVVNANWWDASEGYEVVAVPSMRMIVPLDDLDSAQWINLTGASGHAFSSHYTDQTELWARGDYLPWVFSADAVADATDKTLTLTPPPR
jgi:penicillin amidase